MASKLAAQLYTLRASLQNPQDAAVALARVRKIGYENVQISGFGAVTPEDIRRILDDTGLKAIGVHIGLQALRTEFAQTVNNLNLWGSRHVAVAYLAAGERSDAAAWKARARELSRFGGQLQAEGITLQYHNHAFEFAKFNGKPGLELLYANSDPRFLQAEIDTYWVARGGGDPAAWCRRMRGRMDQVHFKDGVMIGDDLATAEIGEGNLNWPAIIAACRAIGVKHYLVEQDNCPVTNDPFKSLAISLRNLRRMGLK